MPFIAFVLSTLKYEWYIVIRTSVSFLVFLMLSGQPMLICLLSRSVNCLSLSYKKVPASMAATYIHIMAVTHHQMQYFYAPCVNMLVCHSTILHDIISIL